MPRQATVESPGTSPVATLSPRTSPEPTLSAPLNAPSLKLFSGAHWPLALGAVGLVTLGAFENRAVGTALPTLVTEFHAIGSFGLANAAPAASYIIALAITGLWADRRGPVPALRTGAITFALAQLMIGAAVNMPMVIAGRLLSGLAEGLLDIALMVLLARALPAALRPRMFSLFAAMWILPSVFGPVLTGLVTESVGWRWVFLGALALLAPTWLMLQPAIRLTQRARATAPDEVTTVDDATRRDEMTSTQTVADSRAVVRWAVVAAAAIFFLTLAGGLLTTDATAAGVVIAVTTIALVVSAWRLMPAGTFRAARGFPAVVVLRAVIAAAFMGVGAFLPLMLTLLHGFRPSSAGLSLSVTGVTWAFGSWLQGRELSVSRVVLLRVGLTLMTAGLVLTSLLAWTDLTPLVGLTGWAIAGVGIGLSSPTLSVLTLDHSDDGNQGRNQSTAQLAGSMSTAISFAVSGTFVALAAPAPGRLVFALIASVGAGIALLGLLMAGRVTAGRVTSR